MAIEDFKSLAAQVVAEKTPEEISEQLTVSLSERAEKLYTINPYFKTKVNGIDGSEYLLSVMRQWLRLK